jgi:hypothetical protein
MLAIANSEAAVAADGGQGVATFKCARGLAVDSQGRAVVADPCAFSVRRVSQSGAVSRLAGSYELPGHEDGDALDRARFARPIDVALVPRAGARSPSCVLR